MLDEKEIKLIKPIKIPFEYRETVKPRGIFYKGYDLDNEYHIKDYEEITSFVRFMVLIKHGHIYLWCPFLDDIITEAKMLTTKTSILRTIKVDYKDGRYFVRFANKGKKFKCSQVVKIKLYDKESNTI